MSQTVDIYSTLPNIAFDTNGNPLNYFTPEPPMRLFRGESPYGDGRILWMMADKNLVVTYLAATWDEAWEPPAYLYTQALLKPIHLIEEFSFDEVDPKVLPIRDAPSYVFTGVWAIPPPSPDSGQVGAVYEPVPPYVQWEAYNPLNGYSKSIVKVDQNMAPFEIFNESTKTWEPWRAYLTLPEAPIVFLIKRVFTEGDKAQLAFNLSASGLFQPWTEYIRVGDEPEGKGTIDFKTLLKPEIYDGLKKYLTLMPREILWQFFMDKIYPSLPDQIEGVVTLAEYDTSVIYGQTYKHKPYLKMVWAALINVFNQANLEYVNQAQVGPMEWERQKTEAYYKSSSESELQDLRAKLDQYSDIALALDPVAKPIMEAFEKLPKLGDTGFEINRQSAIKELLKKKEYTLAQAVVDAFRYADGTVLGPLLKKPIPVTIVNGQGDPIVRKS